MEPSEVAGLCYGEGFRDKNLITMVAIVGAESNFNEKFISKGGEKYGLFGLRPISLSEDPEALLDPPQATKIARGIYEEKYFAPWLSYATNAYLGCVKIAIRGVGDFFWTLYQDERTT